MVSELDEKLCAAAWGGDAERVRDLVLLGADIECVNDMGNTPLHLAVEQLDVDVARTLLELGADVNKHTPGSGWTPIVHAAEGICDAGTQMASPPDASMILLLLSYGADVTRGTDEGKTALMYAREYGNKMVEEVLIRAGAVM